MSEVNNLEEVASQYVFTNGWNSSKADTDFQVVNDDIIKAFLAGSAWQSEQSNRV